jgi:ribokinase
LSLGVRNVILKLGARGVYLAGKDVDGTFVDAFPVNAVDTTAAGDAFNGAFAYALTENAMAPQEAARFACAVAAFSVTRSGAQTSMPSLSECESFLDQARSNISA